MKDVAIEYNEIIEVLREFIRTNNTKLVGPIVEDFAKAIYCSCSESCGD